MRPPIRVNADGDAKEIIIDQGPDRGNSAEITESPFTSGRADDNTFVFIGEEVPSHHAEITSEGNTFTLRDLGSGSNVTVLGLPGSRQESLSGDQTKHQAVSVVSGSGAVSQVGVKASPDPSLPTYQDTIVHQAPVNHGDSGGLLLNTYGQVVGMTTLTNVDDQSRFSAIGAAYIERLLPMLEGAAAAA